jgi:hypothetical protein
MGPAMILPPKKEERPDDAAFAAQTLGRLPLAEAFYAAWGHVAPDDVLQRIFDDNRGRCYEDTLTFPEVVLALTNALTRHHGSANRALEQAADADTLSVGARAVYAKLSRLPIPLAEALLSGLTARLRCLFPPDVSRCDVPARLAGLSLVVLDGKKIKKAAKRLLATRGRPGKLFGGKILVAYTPKDGLAVALAAEADGDANDIRLVPRVLPLARAAVAGARLWIADAQFCDLDQAARFTEDGDHFLVRFTARNGFAADARVPAREGCDGSGKAYREEWGWMGGAKDVRRVRVRRITLQRPGQTAVAVVTDLLDADAYPAVDLLLAYLMRWQIENVFQQITEVFELQHLIGCAPKATVFQASLCLVIYNVLQVLRAHAAASPAAQQAGVRAVDDVSSEKVFKDLHEELISLKTTLSEAELLGCLPDAATGERTRDRLAELVGRGWSRFWKKTRNKSPRKAKPHARQSGAHTSVHKLLQKAKAARPPRGNRPPKPRPSRSKQ